MLNRPIWPRAPRTQRNIENPDPSGINCVRQGLSDFDAAVLGVYVHGLAGDIAAERIGQTSLIATDIAQALGDAFMRA